MRRRVICVVLSASWVLGILAAEAIGAPQRKSRAQVAKEAVYRSLPVDDMIRQAAENVSRRYNLNPQQTQFTEDMMNKRVTRFLDEHEDEIWPIIRDMARYRNPKNRMDARTARRLGKAIKPIFVEAQKAILEANGEWREILSDEQKKLHDHDLAEMDRTFRDMDERFGNWSRGQVGRHQGIFPPQREDNPPVNPKMPSKISADRVISGSLEWWDGYVESFIKNYELDAGQITTARSILKELKERAAAYQETHKDDLARVEAELAAARKANDPDKINRAEQEFRKLKSFMEPLFEELKTRLSKIPRPAQRQKFESKIKDFRWANRTPDKPDVFKPEPAASATTTAPAKQADPKPELAEPKPQPKAGDTKPEPAPKKPEPETPAEVSEKKAPANT
ncbi:MAG: hypothetical protein JSV19_01175 [Phycisphaerales bacterium]|nr:MAG: hypothetical protein JSV19_01175 [Phycisphaerales bacterium]